MAGPDLVPRFARPFVIGFVALMIASAAFVWEPWPFTSYRLFSQLRIDEQRAWVVRSVDGDGSEATVPLAGELRGFEFQMREFVDADAARQDELCRLWARSAPAIVGRPVTEVRLYERRWRLAEREGDRATPGTSELVYVCDSDGASDAR